MARSKIRAEQSAAKAGPVAEPRLAETAYQAILQGLFDRTIPAGVDLSQSWLIDTLGLTAQPLRDALRKLEMEGLAKIYPRSCIRFIKADAELAISTYQFRSLIERAGARALAEIGDAIPLQDLAAEHTALLTELEKGAFGPDEEVMLTALEERLHGALLSALRNPLIETTARRLHKYIQLVRLDHLVTRPLAIRTLREHLAVLNAAIRHDPDSAEAAIADHLRQALQRVLGII